MNADNKIKSQLQNYLIKQGVITNQTYGMLKLGGKQIKFGASMAKWI
jgi:hypothetical protein